MILIGLLLSFSLDGEGPIKQLGVLHHISKQHEVHQKYFSYVILSVLSSAFLIVFGNVIKQALTCYTGLKKLMKYVCGWVHDFQIRERCLLAKV